jgi:pimeloyl-ACP methyl ester carboxylesterase
VTTISPASSPRAGGVPVGETDVITLRTADEILLQGLWRRHPDTGAVVVVAHGFTGSTEDAGVSQLAAALYASGFDVLTYDARGHGASGGRSGVGSMEHLDVASAAERAAECGLPVVLVGVSMGAIGVVRHLATSPADVPAITGAVLISGPARWRMRPSSIGVLNAVLTRTRLGRWAAARWLGVRIEPGWQVGETPESMMRRVSVPVAVIHGANDRLLSFAHGESLHHSAGGPSQLDLVVGMGHGLGDGSQTAAVAAVQWVLETASNPDSVGRADHPELTRTGLDGVTVEEKAS